MSEWVPVDRSPPEDGYTALVIDRDGDMFVAYWSEEYGEFCLNYDYFNGDSVTHWMALPQPPERQHEPSEA